ncbi:MAG TPA: DUF930 domain-containing protein [Pseudolabrys sp.]|jgi:hypothetical protein|nr:DUF930 domain-containing protein [Pseudolabrys sp.]
MRQTALAIGTILLIATGTAAAGNRFERSLLRLSPGERLVQLCDYTAMQHIRREHGDYRPDRAVADARSRVYINKDTVDAKGGAFRSKRKWYALSYKCTASPDDMKVRSFTYKIGPEIPQSKWALYSLWD